MEQTANHFPTGIEAWDWAPIGADNLCFWINLEAAEGERDATCGRVGVIGRLVDLDAPVGFRQGEAFRGNAVFAGGIELLIGLGAFVVFFDGLERRWLVINVHHFDQLFERISDQRRRGRVPRLQMLDRLLIEDLIGLAARFIENGGTKFSVGIHVCILAFIEEAKPLAVDHDTERVR